jgi:large subunit ribosomal protein L25
MSLVVTLKAQARTGSGSRAAIKLRKSGFVPGVVYGHKLANAQVAVNAEELDRAIRVQHARVIDRHRRRCSRSAVAHAARRVPAG